MKFIVKDSQTDEEPFRSNFAYEIIDASSNPLKSTVDCLVLKPITKIKSSVMRNWIFKTRTDEDAVQEETLQLPIRRRHQQTIDVRLDQLLSR
jgi:hypothetical protein